MEYSNETTQNDDHNITITANVPPNDINSEGIVNESQQTENIDTNTLIESLIESHFNETANSDRSTSLSHNTSENDLLNGDNDVDESNDTTDDQSTIPEKAAIPKPEKLCHLPLGSVKRIVKSDPDVTLVSAESVFLISKATELFLQWLGKEVHSYTVQQKKKTIHIRDLNSAINEIPALQFLDGALD